MSISKTELLRQAEKLTAQGDISGALTVYRKLLSENPLDLVCVSAVGDLYIKSGSPQKAVEFFIHTANGYLKTGSMNSALNLIKKAIKLEPANVAANLRLGEIYLQDGHYQKAHDCFIEAGATLSQQGKFDEAVEISKKALLADPESRQAKAALSALQDEIDQQGSEPALAPLHTDVNLEPIYISIHEEPAAAVSLGKETYATPQDAQRLQELAASFDLEIQMDDKTVIGKIAQAEVLAGYGRTDEAIGFLQEVLWSRPDFIDVRVRLKDVYLRAAMYDKACEECITIAGLYAALKDHERAKDYLIRARLIQAQKT